MLLMQNLLRSRDPRERPNPCPGSNRDYERDEKDITHTTVLYTYVVIEAAVLFTEATEIFERVVRREVFELYE